MLEILTVLLVAIIATGVIMIVFSEGELVIALNGVMLSVFGASALLTTAKMTAAARHQQSLRWLYEPLTTLPDWVLTVGVAITAALSAVLSGRMAEYSSLEKSSMATNR